MKNVFKCVVAGLAVGAYAQAADLTSVKSSSGAEQGQPVTECSTSETIFDKSEIKALADRVRMHQVKRGLRFKNQHWVRGTYYAGLMAVYESTSDRGYLDDCINWGKKVSWRIKENSGGPYESGSYPLFVGRFGMGVIKRQRTNR